MKMMPRDRRSRRSSRGSNKKKPNTTNMTFLLGLTMGSRSMTLTCSQGGCQRSKTVATPSASRRATISSRMTTNSTSPASEMSSHLPDSKQSSSLQTKSMTSMICWAEGLIPMWSQIRKMLWTSLSRTRFSSATLQSRINLRLTYLEMEEWPMGMMGT